MHSATILAAENKALRTANEKIQKKRQRKRLYIGKGGILSVREVQEAQSGAIIGREVENRGVEQSEPSVLNRAPYIYSVCRSLEHTAYTCPERQ